MSEYVVDSMDLEAISLATQMTHGLTRKLQFPDDFAVVASSSTVSPSGLTATSELDTIATETVITEGTCHDLAATLHLTLAFTSGDSGGVTIEWGDGYKDYQTASTSPKELSVSHMYSWPESLGTERTYLIKITPDDNSYWSPGYSTGYGISGQINSTGKTNTYPRIQAARLGARCRLDQAKGFYNCTALRYVSIPNLDQYYYKPGTFDGCTALEMLALDGLNGLGVEEKYTILGPNRNVKCVGNAEKMLVCNGQVSIYEDPNSLPAFSGSKLKEITFPKSLTIVPAWSFYYCTALETIRFLGGVTNIRMSAFTSCGALTSIYFYGPNPPAVEPGAFSGMSNDLVIYVPFTSLSAYQNRFSDYFDTDHVKAFDARA